MGKRKDNEKLCLDSLMRSYDPKVKRYYFNALEKEGIDGYNRALLRTAVYFKNLLPKRMHGPLARECRKAGIAV